MDKKISKPHIIKVKSGRLPYVHDSRTFDLADYLDQENLSKIPLSCNWGNKIETEKWGTLGNLRINDCTCAAAGHLIMAWTSSIGKLHKPSTKAIVQSYSDLTGFNPKTDGQGKSIEAIKALKHWRKKGIAGHRIIAFAKLDFKNRRQLLQAIYLYGGCYVGINLPKSAEKQYFDSKKWTVPRSGTNGAGEPGSWLGHALTITGYNKNELRAVTWGKEMTMTMDFWETYVDEAYAVFSEDFIKNEKTPTKINANILQQEIKNLKKRKAGKKKKK
ncbi:MAG: hypothetical protein M3139_02850 [Bacteroidota bacterium]|nr:hypothetical protein [Bacteroidota bacterium]